MSCLLPFFDVFISSDKSLIEQKMQLDLRRHVKSPLSIRNLSLSCIMTMTKRMFISRWCKTFLIMTPHNQCFKDNFQGRCLQDIFIFIFSLLTKSFSLLGCEMPCPSLIHLVKGSLLLGTHPLLYHSSKMQ